MFIRLSRFRSQEGNEAEGLRILQVHANIIAAVEGCKSVWAGQGQHPSADFVVIGLSRAVAFLRKFEGRLRIDPSLESDVFSLV